MINHLEIFSYLQEPHILKKFTKYNFTQKIISSFQDYDNLYLVTEFYEGENLYSLKDEKMTEEQIKFIAASIVQIFIYLRKENIIHRDISMKNLILDNDNYLNILDFSYATKYQNKIDPKNYLICYYDIDNPPEIQTLSEYDYTVDYYRLGGSILYFLIFKQYANAIKRDNNINELVISQDTVKNISYECIDFINKLIINEPSQRLGFKNIEEMKIHPWFYGFNWAKFEKKEIKSPLNYDKKKKDIQICEKFNFEDNTQNKFKTMMRKKKYKKLMRNYQFVNKDIVSNIIDSIFNKDYF